MSRHKETPDPVGRELDSFTEDLKRLIAESIASTQLLATQTRVFERTRPESGETREK